MRLGPGLIVVVAALLALTACGETNTLPTVPTSTGPIHAGPSGVWVYRPAGEPKDLVVFFHGQGGPVEATPANHLPWIRHLVARGSVVVYPRYEMDFETDPMQFAVAGIRRATKEFDADGLPVLVIGYSRGGAIAVEYGAVAADQEVPVPDTIMSVFPAGLGNQGRVIDLRTLGHSTQLLMLVGDMDTVVGGSGAAHLSQRLEAAAFPGENIALDFVQSHGSFTADHFAPLRTSPGARAAFWKRADEVLDDIDRW